MSSCFHIIHSFTCANYHVKELKSGRRTRRNLEWPRSGTAADSTGGKTPVSSAQQFGLLRLRALDAAALPAARSRIPRAGFGVDILPAWRYGLRWDGAVENALL